MRRSANTRSIRSTGTGKPSAEALPSDDHPTEYIRYIDTRPDSSFFTNRLSRFVRNMDSDDYRCKVVKHGIVKELSFSKRDT